MRPAVLPPMRLALLGLALLALPTASADAYIHGRLAPPSQALTLVPGARTDLDYDWSVTFENTTCTSPVEFGVDFVVVSDPLWAGASFEPMGARGFSPRASNRTQLEIVVDGDGPRPADGRVEAALDLHVFDVSGCAPSPKRWLEGANVTIHVAGPSGATQTTATGRTSGALDVAAVVAACAVAVAFARRR
jgi:hypothetical protein